MKLIIKNLFVALCWLVASQVFGQITTTITPATSTVPVGNQVTLTLKATGFQNIVSVQFPITYDTTLLRFDSLSNFGLPDMTIANYNRPRTANYVGISWVPNFRRFMEGVTLDDGTTLFTIHFTVKANGVSVVNLSNSVSRVPLQFVKNPSVQQTVSFSAGGATITGGSGSSGGGGGGTGGGGTGGGGTTVTGTAIVVGNVSVRSGEVVCAPVSVNEFTKIAGMAWALSWDPAVLTFRNTQSYNLAGLDCTSFNASTAGRLVLGWLDPDPNAAGITLTNGTRIFEVCFTARGANGTTTPITPGKEGLVSSVAVSIENNNGVNLWQSTSGVAGQAAVAATAPAQNPNITAGLWVERDSVPSGNQTCVDVRVTRFTNITAFQYGLSYDPTLLEFVSTQGGPLNLTTGTTTSSNIRVVEPGKIRVNWIKSATAQPVTYTDNTVLMSVCFRGIGAAGTTSPVSIVTLPSPNTTAISVEERDCNIVPALTAGSVRLLTSPNSAATANTTVTAVSCFGQNNGSITLNVAGGISPYTFAWDGPGITTANRTVQSPTGLAAGTYTVTVTTSTSLTSTATAVITGPTAALSLTASQLTVANVSCSGPNTGRITTGTPTGGTGPYTFNWGGPGINTANQTLQSPTNLSMGTYTVTVTDARSCTTTATASVGSASTISASATATNVKCFGQSSGSITLTAPTGGTAPYTYAWRTVGGTTNVSTVANPTNLAAGSYNVTVTDAAGCVFSLAQPVVISAPTSALAFNPALTNGTCSGGSINLNATGGTAPYTAQWSGGLTATTTTVSNVGTGTYTATVTDAAGCTAVTPAVNVTATAIIITAPNPTVTSPVCPGQNTGAITIAPQGGRAPYTVSWHNMMTGNTINGLASGPYYATVSDADGCTSTLTVTISGPAQLTAPDATRVISNITCFGAGDGSISIEPTGGTAPYNIAWTGGLAGKNIFQLNAGAYTATITDARGCTATAGPYAITSPTALTLAKTVTLIGATTTGGITLNVSGGVGPYKYDWADLTGTDDPKDRTGITTAGSYTVTVTDANGCRVPETIVVENDNPLRNARIGSTKDACSADGQVVIDIPSIAQSPYVVTWDGGSRTTTQTSYTVTGLTPGLYRFTVTDAGNRTITLPATTISQLAPALVADQSVQPTESLRNGVITLTPSPATADFAYIWSNGLTTAAVSNLDSGRYVVTVTNKTSGCTAVYTYNLTRQYEAMSVRLDTLRPDCRDARNGRLTATVAGGDRNYTYAWSGPNSFTSDAATIENLPAGTYALTVTDGRGVSVTRTSIVLQNRSALTITGVSVTSSYRGFQVSGEGVCDGIAIVQFTGQPAGSPVDIRWSNNVTVSENRTLCGGAYSVTVSDMFGCTVVNTGELTAPAAIAVSLDNGSGKASCYSRCDALAQARVSGGIAPYRVRWSIDPATRQDDFLTSAALTSDRSNLCAGSYVVTVTDANNVTRTFTVAVTQPEQLRVEFSTLEPNTFTRCDGEVFAKVSGGASGSQYTYTWASTRSNGPRGTGQRADNLCGGDVIQFIVSDQNNCRVTAIDTLPYPADGCLQVSPVLTPGEQDGINDYMIIACIEAEPRNTVEVYNRWGQLVYETTGYDNSTKRWTGTTSRGVALPEGIYYYIITLTNDSGAPVQRKGFVNLMR